jgi:hypothetical protein
MESVDFAKIRFGKASAEAESASAPDLLIEGYLDASGVSAQAIQGDKFLFLGYKGSGKTALAEHLKLRSSGDPFLFVRQGFLSAFPYRSFNKIVSGSAEPETKYPTAWLWILLVLILDSLRMDNGLRPSDSAGFEAALAVLEKAGLLPIRNLHELVVASTKRSFKINLPFEFGGVSYEAGPSTGEDVKFLHLVENLKRVVLSARSDARHIVIIDGLDDILSEREVQYQSLAALMNESMRLNTELAQAGSPTKVVVLCRTDLYERLPGPNKNKIRQDFSAEFDWYHDPREPQASGLVRLANLRAKMADAGINDLFSRFFPKHVDDFDVVPGLLVNSRHTPRDFLQLLSHLQKYWQKGQFTREQLLSGLRDYSINYFLPEIKDELVGYISAEHTDAVLKLIGSMGKRDFGLLELREAAKKPRYADLDVERICEILYEASAIGHIDRRPSGANHFSFKFRNRHSSFNPNRRIVLHRGIWKAMNLT